MTHAIRLTDGTNTISLVDDGVLLTNYTPATPKANDATVTDAIEIYAHASTKAALVLKVRELETMLNAASRRKNDTVFLEVMVDGQTTWWRSPVYAGRVDLDDNTLAEWANVKAEAVLHIERAPYFEGTETLLSVTGQGLGARTSLAMSNGLSSWIGVSSTQVGGSLPTPARLRLINRAGLAVSFRTFYLAVNAFNTPGNFNYVNPLNLAATWTAGTNHTNTGGKWKVKLTQAQIEACNGDSFHVIAAFDPMTATAYIRGYVGNYDYHDQAGPEVFTGVSGSQGEELIDLGSFNIPSSRGSANNECNIHITVRSQLAGFGTLKYIYLMPTESFRVWRQDSFSNADGVFVEENGPEEAVYRGFSTTRYGGVQAFGQPLMLWPGREQRIYVAFNEASGSFQDGRRVDAQLWCRPRRLTV